MILPRVPIGDQIIALSCSGVADGEMMSTEHGATPAEASGPRCKITVRYLQV